jgi:hypothetical protein
MSGGHQYIEASQATPHPRTLQALARALGVGVQELLAPVPVLRHVRFRSRRRLPLREQVLATVACRLADLNSLEELLGLHPRPWVGPLPLLPELPGPERALRAAAWVRERLGLKEDEPLAHLGPLLEAHGIKLLLLEVHAEGFFGLSVAAEHGEPAISCAPSARASMCPCGGGWSCWWNWWSATCCHPSAPWSWPTASSGSITL